MFNLPLQNKEGYKKYNIDKDWYKNKKHGITAMIRVRNEEQWIGPCIESILPFFDEIIISSNSDDHTDDIITNFNSEKIRLFNYPFEITDVNGTADASSVHSNSFYYNWTMSKTNYDMVCKWDGDMIMLPFFFYTYHWVLSHDVVRVKGVNIVDKKNLLLSYERPVASFESRFFNISRYCFYVLGSKQLGRDRWGTNDFPVSKLDCLNYDLWRSYPMMMLRRMRNMICKKDVCFNDSMYIHTKMLKKNMDDFVYHHIDKYLVPGCFFKSMDEYL